MKAVFVGSPQLAANYLEKLSAQINFSLVITGQPKASGRGLKLTSTPVAQMAQKLKLNLLEVADINSQECLEALNAAAAELAIVIAFGQKINREVRGSLKHGFINLHFSLLPKLRGADPVAAAIKLGLETTGVSVFEIEDELDAGRIYTRKEIAISESETTKSLFKKLMPLGEQAILETLEKIENGDKPTPQQGSPTFAPKTQRTNFQINWSDTQKDIERLVRSGIDNKTAWTMFDRKIIKILEVRCSELADFGRVGELKVEEFASVQTGSGVLELIKLKPEGKNEMLATEWAKGLKSSKVIFT